MRDSLRVLLSKGVDAASGGVRDGRATNVRALTGFGRNSLLSSLVGSTNTLFLRLRFAKAGRSIWRVFPRESAEVKDQSNAVERLGAQPPERDYNTGRNIVNSILPCLTNRNTTRLTVVNRGHMGLSARGGEVTMRAC